MISEWHIQRKGDSLLLGIAIKEAVLDVVTDQNLLLNCLTMLESPHKGLVSNQLGQFGIYPVTLNLHHDDTTSIFIDGPDFDPPRTLSAAIWVDKGGLIKILQKAKISN
jgi:hypothetical protein